MGLYLVPATRDNLEQTIERSLPDVDAAPHIDATTLLELKRRCGLEGLRCWAMTRTKWSVFDAMMPGDDVLLTEKDTGYFTHYGRVVGKIESTSLGKSIWPIVGEQPWELIYFLTNVRHIRVPKADFVRALGYASNYQVAGSLRVRDEGLEVFEQRFASIKEWLGLEVGIANADVMPGTTDEDYTGTDLLAPGKRRQGHALFAQRVKENYGYACALCGIAEERFLVAGHIVGWAEDRTNRLNPANGICLCVLHDRAFEANYITLDERLCVTVSPRLDSASSLGAVLRPLDGTALRVPMRAPPDAGLLAVHRGRLLR
jgi:hypothetical protein